MVIGKGKPVLLVSDFDLKLAEEGFRNFDSKPLTEDEERFIKNRGELLDKIPRG